MLQSQCYFRYERLISASFASQGTLKQVYPILYMRNLPIRKTSQRPFMDLFMAWIGQSC